MKKLIVLVALLFAIKLGYAADSNLWIEVEGGDWLPDNKIMGHIRSGVRHAVEKSAKKEAKQLKLWESYVIQYQGVVRNSSRFIFLSAFCKYGTINKPIELNKSFFMAKDGGSCFFQLKYDPDRKEFYEVFINGEA